MWQDISKAKKDGTQYLVWASRGRRVLKKKLHMLAVYRKGEWITLPGGWPCSPTKFQELTDPPKED